MYPSGQRLNRFNGSDGPKIPRIADVAALTPGSHRAHTGLTRGSHEAHTTVGMAFPASSMPRLGSTRSRSAMPTTNSTISASRAGR